jgi:hypothetical protein
MKRLLVFLLICPQLYAQVPQTVTRTFKTLAEMDASGPSRTETICEVLGRDTPGDGSGRWIFEYQATNSLPTNHLIRGLPTNYVGRRVLQWSGDASFFVSPSTNDAAAGLTLASAYAVTNGIPLLITQPGEYRLKAASGLNLLSGAHVVGHPGVVLVGDRDGLDGSGFATPAKAFIRNSGNVGYQTSGELVVVNTNITVEGLSFRAADSNAAGFPMSFVGVDGLTIRNCRIGRAYEAWAIQVCSHNVAITGCEVDNPGEVYQDGIHIDGGTRGLISDCRLRTGDDGVAFGQHAVPIRQWTVQNVTVHSDYGHFFRGYVGSASATNFIEDIVIYGMAGVTGVRNAMGRLESHSTNEVYPFKRWSINGVRGPNQQPVSAPIGFDAGFIIEHGDDIKLDDLTVPFSKECNYFFRYCGRVSLSRSKGFGTSHSVFHQAVRVEDVEDMVIRDVEIQNANTNSGAYGLFVLNAGKFTAENVDVSSWDNALVIQAADEFKYNAGRLVSTNARAITSTTNPTSLFLTGNFISDAVSPYWEGGSPPVSAQISGNIGVTIVGAVSGTSHDVYTTAGTLIGKLTTEENNKTTLVTEQGRFVIKMDEVDGVSNKVVRFGSQSYSNSLENPNAMLVALDTGAFSILQINGGTAEFNGHRWIQLYATGTNRTPGVLVGQFSYPTGTNGSLLETSLRLNFTGSTGSAPYVVWKDTNGFLRIP